MSCNVGRHNSCWHPRAVSSYTQGCHVSYQHLQLLQHHSETKPIKIQLVPATCSSVILEVCRMGVKYEPSIWPHSVNQVDGTPARCLGSIPSGTQIFCLPHARVMLIINFHFHTCFTELKVYHLSFLSTLPLGTNMEWLLYLRVILAPVGAFDPWRCEQGSQPSLFLFVILELWGNWVKVCPQMWPNTNPVPPPKNS